MTTMFWNGRRFTRCEAGGVAFVRVLGAAATVAVVSSCTTMEGRSEPDVGDAAISRANAEEVRHSPPVMQLDPALSEEIKDHVYEIYSGLPGVERDRFVNVYVTISYVDPEDREKLLSVATTLPDSAPEMELQEKDADLLRIPIDPKEYTADYGQLIIVFTGSPDEQTPCGNSGGTNYCDF